MFTAKTLTQSLCLLGLMCITLPARGALVSQYTYESDTLNTTGTSVSDDGPSSNTGTLQGNAVIINEGGQRGKVMSLDGSGDFSLHPDSASLDISGNAIALTGWVNLDTTSGRVAFLEKDGATDNAYSYEINNNSGQLRFFLWDPNSSLTASNAPIGSAWHHLAGTYDGANMRAYIDGIEQNSLARTANISTNNSPLWIGRTQLSGNATAYADGLMDDVGIYDSTLNAQQVSAIHGLGRFSAVDQADSFVGDVLTAFAATGSATTGTHQWSYATATQLGTSGADPIGTSNGAPSVGNTFFTLDSSGNGMQLTVQGEPVSLVKVDLHNSGDPANVQVRWDEQGIPTGPAGGASFALTLTAEGTAAGITATLGGDSDGWESRGPGNGRLAVTGTSFNQLLEDLVATRDGAATVDLTGLTIGTQYTLETWHNDPVVSGFGTGGGTVIPTILGATLDASTNGTITNLFGAQSDAAFGITSIFFTATSSSPTITLTKSGGTNAFLPISGVQFTVVPATAIPEPSTLALAALGLLSLGFVGWRSRRR